MIPLDGFQQFLAQHAGIKEKNIDYYLLWIKKYQMFLQDTGKGEIGDIDSQNAFFAQLGSSYEEWQVKQASEAVRLFVFFITQKEKDKKTVLPIENNPAWQEALQKMHTMLRLRQRALSTEKTYISWIRQFYIFVHGLSPDLLKRDHVRDFITFLAVERRISPSTQNQAFNSLLFFCRHVLDLDLGDLSDTVRAKKKPRLPVVLTPSEVRRVFAHLEGTHLLMGRVIYGGGLRLQECLRLRVKDIDFEQRQIVVRSGKGDKDRITVLPESIIDDLYAHFQKIKVQYEADRKRDVAGVSIGQAKCHGRDQPA